MLFSDSGIINKAREAADATKNAQSDTEKGLSDLEGDIGEALGEATPIADAIEKGEDFAKDKNKKVEDEFGNPVTIPAGFHIVTPTEDSTVDYNYSETNQGTPTVQDGIVVEDGEGNQFVWIPVGTIKNKTGASEDTTITLARYSFDVIGDGTATPVQTADQYENADTEAKDLKGFLDSAKKNGGYYLARYEAGKNSADGTKPVSKAGPVWNEVSQPDAETAAKAMYTSDN